MALNSFSKGVNQTFSTELNENFADTATWYVERTDTNASNLVGSSTLSLKQTFTFSGFATDWAVEAVEIDGLTFSTSGSTDAFMGVELTDDSSIYGTWVYQSDGATSNYPTLIIIAGASSPQPYIKVPDGASNTFDFVQPVPASRFTGATSWKVKIYIGGSSSGVGTLTKGYTVRLRVKKQVINTATATAQA